MPITISITKAKTQDALNQCLKIRKEVFILEKAVPKEIEIDSLDCLSAACEHFLILSGENIIGTFRAVFPDSNTVKIQRFCLLKKYRGKGAGKAAVLLAEKYYKAKGKRFLSLNAKFSVYPFYEKCGFIKTSDVFLEAGVEHVQMIKPL